MTIYFYKVSEFYGCFSNFSPHAIQLRGQSWPTTEHYYQAQKFLNTEDEALCLVIQAVQTPGEAAAIGRDSSHRIRADWEQVKNQIMREAVLTKFLTHLDIQAVLLSTGEHYIVENSPTDAYWGCGSDRKGQNQLGRTLMSVRQEIHFLLAQTRLRS